jgi:hypothetical protein
MSDFYQPNLSGLKRSDGSVIGAGKPGAASHEASGGASGPLVFFDPFEGERVEIEPDRERPALTFDRLLKIPLEYGRRGARQFVTSQRIGAEGIPSADYEKPLDEANPYWRENLIEDEPDARAEFHTLLEGGMPEEQARFRAARNWFDRRRARKAEWLRIVEESAVLENAPEFTGRSSGLLEDVVGTMITSAPGTAGMLVSPALGVPMIYYQMRGALAESIEQSAAARGIEIDPERTFRAASAGALAATPLEAVGELFKIKAMVGSGPWTQQLLRISEAFGGEALTEFVQNYPETAALTWALNPDLPPERLTEHIREVLLSGATFEEGLYDALVGGLAGAGTATAGLSIHRIAGRLIAPEQRRIAEEREERIRTLLSSEEMTAEQRSEFLRLVGYGEEEIAAAPEEQVREIVAQVKARLLYQAAPIESEEKNLLRGQLEAGGMPAHLRDTYLSIWDGMARVAAEEGLIEKPADFYSQWLSEVRFADTVDKLAGSYENALREVEFNEIQEPSKYRQLEIDFSRPQSPPPAQRPPAPTLSPFVLRTRMVTTGHLRSGSLRIESPADAASLLAHIRKGAQEYLYTVATDEAGNILEVHRYTKGVRMASQASATELVGRIFNTAGARRVYVAHNHPSAQDTEASRQDVELLAVIRSGLVLRGIETVPIVISGTKYGTWDPAGAEAQLGQAVNDLPIPPALRRHLVPEKERMLSRSGRGPNVKNPQESIAAKLAAKGPGWEGVQLLTTKNEIIGYVDLPVGEKLGEAAARIVAEVERGNASGMILFNNGPLSDSRKELVRGLYHALADVAVHDVIFDDNTSMGGVAGLTGPKNAETGAQGYRRLAADTRLYQAHEARAPRGAVHNLFENAPKIIELFEGADPSTAIHETGHLILAMMYQAGSPDYLAAARWAGVDEERSFQGLEAWSEEEHERFAKAFELYMMEGRAPTFRLQQVFRRMKEVLLRIYKSLSNRYFGDVSIDEEIRGLFDRWLATEQERATDPVWEVAEWLRAGDEELAETERIRREEMFRAAHPGETAELEYEELLAHARSQVAGELARREALLEKDLRAQFRKEAESSIAEDPFFQMLDELLENGGMRLSSLQAMYDRAYIADVIRRRPGIVGKDGISPDIIAEQYGYRDIDGVIQDILNRPTKSEAVKEYFESLWREYEATEHLNHAGLYVQALDVEIEILNRLMGKTAPPVRRDLKGVIRAKTGQVRTPDSRRLAEDLKRDAAIARTAWNEARKAAREEFNGKLSAEKRAAAAGQRAAALEKIAGLRMKHREDIQALRAHYKAARHKEKVHRRIGRVIRNRSMLPEYKAQIVNFLSRYYRIPKRWSVEPPEMTLEEFIRAKETEGETVDSLIQLLTLVPPPKSKGFLTAEEVRAVGDVVDALAHMERVERKDELLTQKAAFREVVNELVGAIAGAHRVAAEERHPLEIARERLGFLAQARESVKAYFAQLKKAEFILRALDGWKDFGANQKRLFEPVKHAEDAELELGREYTEKLKAAFDGFDGAWARKKYRIPGLSALITKEEMIMVMLNSGNDGNRAALHAGNQISQEVINEIAGRLTGREVDLVYRVWDIIDSLFPRVNDVHKRLTGVALRKVDGRYFPLVFSKKLSWRAGEHEAKRQIEDMFANEYIRPKVEAGHRLERKGGKMGVELTFDVIGRHLQKVVHDITHQIPVRDVQRLILAPEYRDAIGASVGEDAYRQLMPWLQGVARPRREPMTMLEQWIGRIRRNTTVVALGLKVTVAEQQFLAITNTMNELGALQTMKGIRQFYGNPWRARDFIYERSPSMRARQRTWDRELEQFYGRFNPKEWKGSQAVKDSYFALIGMMDQATALPSWLAAYDAGIGRFGDEAKAVEYADGVVRRTQATASPKDLSEIQRGGELRKLFTSFYTFFNAFYNLMSETHARYRAGSMNLPQLVKSYWLLLVLPAVLGSVIREKDLDPEEILKAVFSYGMAGMPGIRDLGNAFISDYGYSLSPAEGLGKEIHWAAKNLQSGHFEKLPKRAVMIGGYLGGLPSQQIVITAEGALDLAAGETRNPFRLFYRKPKKEKD